MKSRNLLLALIGGTILFIGLDSTNAHMGSLGVRSLRKPIRVAFMITGKLRSAVLFLLAVCTYLLIAVRNK